MGYASRAGRAKTNPASPRAHAICDRCGFRYNRENLRYQLEWGGAALINLRLLVCQTCYDTPQEQNRAIVVPADPVPIVNPRPQDYVDAEVDYMTLTPATKDPNTGLPIPNTTVMTTVSAGDFDNDFNSDFLTGSPVQQMTRQPLGAPKGYTQNAQMGLVADVRFAVVLPVISIISDGMSNVIVTTSSPHGLSADSQVALQGLSNSMAAGTYSVSVSNATQFVYQPGPVIPSGSLLMATTLVTTMDIGIPLNMDELPKTG